MESGSSHIQKVSPSSALSKLVPRPGVGAANRSCQAVLASRLTHGLSRGRQPDLKQPFPTFLLVRCTGARTTCLDHHSITRCCQSLTCFVVMGPHWENVPALQVMSCIADNCSGTLCLDVDSGPKWQIDCNVCGDLRTRFSFEEFSHCC